MAPLGVATACSLQRVPFQRSISAKEVLSVPTAMQALAEVQATPVSLPEGDNPLVWICQSEPFHRSASGVLSALPTATHSETEAHDMYASPTTEWAGSLGVFCNDHRRPFQ